MSPDQQCAHYLDYFVRTLTVEYPVELWSHYGRAHKPRTNNHVEGHNRMVKEVHRHDPNIYTWIEIIQSLEFDNAMHFINR